MPSSLSNLLHGQGPDSNDGGGALESTSGGLFEPVKEMTQKAARMGDSPETLPGSGQFAVFKEALINAILALSERGSRKV